MTGKDMSKTLSSIWGCKAQRRSSAATKASNDERADDKGNNMTLTPKQENFVLAYLETGNASEAYRRAYKPSAKAKESTINRTAKRCIDSPKIRARIEELRAPIREKVGITLEDHLTTLKDLREKAIAAGQYGPAITAEMSRGKVSGLYVEKRENKNTVEGEITVKHGVPDDVLDILRELNALPEGME